MFHRRRRRVDDRPELPPPGRALRVKRRLFGLLRLGVAALASLALVPMGGAGAPGDAPAGGPAAAAPATAPASPSAAAPGGGVPPEVVDALKGLAVTADRERLYGVLADKGDARIIPALNAFVGDHLRLLDGRLVMNGPVARKAEVNNTQQDFFPVLDAVTGEPVTGPAGQPLFQRMKGSRDVRDFDRSPEYVRLPNKPDGPTEKTFPGIGAPSNRRVVAELVATLSLLHPDPEVRLASIRDAGERAARVFPNVDDEAQVKAAMAVYAERAAAGPFPATLPSEKNPEAALLAAIAAAQADKPAGLFGPAPGEDAMAKVATPLDALVKAAKEADLWPKEGGPPPANPRIAALAKLAEKVKNYREGLAAQKKNLEELPRYAAPLRKQLAADPNGPFAPTYKEAVAQMDVVLGDPPARAAAVTLLGDSGTMRAENILRKLRTSAERTGDGPLVTTVAPALQKAEGYQQKVRLVLYTFAGLSTGSIAVLMALGLAIIFGLMGVINMAHGEFMMVGAFTTYVVSQWFRSVFPGAYDVFPVVAVPAAFLVAGVVGLLTEYLVIRHLYGRTTETLIATIGVGLILVQVARVQFGDSLSVGPPRWMQGSMEVAPDLLLNRARVWTIAYCALCITVVYLVVNKTKLGLLLRATTQNRKMAAALGVPTRLVDALTFAFGAGLAGMAGVVVPMIDKINPGMGQDYVVQSFMVVVVGGVGKLAGSIVAGFGLGLTGNYLEPFLGSFQAFAKTSSVLSKVLVLSAVVLFLQWKPSGLFPPKGRVADA